MVRSQELKSAVFSDFLVSGGGGGVGCPPNFHAEEDGNTAPNTSPSSPLFPPPPYSAPPLVLS